MTAPASLLDLEFVWVTGKGGVGKTTVAAALAEVAAASSRRTLVCEMDAKGALAEAFDAPEFEFQPTEVAPNLFAMAMNTEDALREYLRLFVKVPFIGRIGPLARTFDFVADAAPGVKEILAVGKLCYEVRERSYDLVVVDAEATGHIVSQVAAPRVIRDLVQVGLVREQTEWMLDILEDDARTGVVVVTTPEEMPVTESIEMIGQLVAQTDVAVHTVVANRVLPALFDRREMPVFEALGTVVDELVAAAGKGVETVLDASRFTEERRRTGVEHIGRLREALDEQAPGAEVLTVPELFARSSGPRVVNLVAGSLAADLDVPVDSRTDPHGDPLGDRRGTAPGAANRGRR